MGCQSVFSGKTRKDPKRVNRLGNTAGQGDIDFAQPQHLNSLNDSCVAGRTRRAHGVMRACQPKVQRHLPGRVIGNRTRVVVMRPILSVIAVLADNVNLVLRFNRTMLGNADERARNCAKALWSIRILSLIESEHAGSEA